MRTNLIAAMLVAVVAAPMWVSAQSGAGMSSMEQTSIEVTAAQEEINKPCQQLIGVERAACISKSAKEVLLKLHPCAEAMQAKACQPLVGVERAACIKQQAKDCRTERKDMVKEKAKDLKAAVKTKRVENRTAIKNARAEDAVKETVKTERTENRTALKAKRIVNQ